MPIVPQWSDEHKNCIIVTYQGHWTWDEFQEGVKATNSLMNSVDYPVILIHDTLEGSTLPSGNILAQASMAVRNFENNLLLIIVVMNSTLIRTFVKILVSLNPVGRGDLIKTVATLEAALNMAEKTTVGL